MLHAELTQTEIDRRRKLTENIRNMIIREMMIRDPESDCVLTSHRDFFLQISFSEIHPLMVFSLAKPIEKPDLRMIDICNEMNMNSVLGTHALNDQASCYHYRATHWLECEIDRKRFLEILDRCTDEAVKGYYRLIT